MEPDERLQLPPAGGRRDAGAGAGLRPGHGDLGARHRESRWPGPRRGLRDRRLADQLLRQCRGAVRHRALQDAVVHPAVGPDPAGALWRAGPEGPPLPLRGAGQLPRSHRAAAREQRLPHPDRGPGGHAQQGRPLPGPAVAGLERGAGPAASVRPAVVAAAAAGAGLRDRPAGIRGPVRRLPRGRGQGRRAQQGRTGAAGLDRRDGRRPERHRLHEDRAGRLQRQAGALGRDRRHDGGRRQPLDRHRGFAVVSGRELHRDGRSTPGSRGGRAHQGVARGPRRGRCRRCPG